MNQILVVMPNWFGEVLFATPLLQALRRMCPEAFVAALGVPRAVELLAHDPRLDERILYDEEGVHRRWVARRRLVAILRARRFETALILRRSLSRTLLLALAGIRRRIGFANAKSGWLLTHRLPAPPPTAHKADAYLRLLEPLDAQMPSVTSSGQREPYRYYPSDQERAQVGLFLRQHGLPDSRPFVALHPGANWPHKRWPAQRFAELANRLSRAQRCAVVLTGAPEDGPRIEEIRRRLDHPLILLAGKTTIRQLAACLERAELIVSNDTGALHLASALGRPVVALYGPTSPAITGPLGDPTQTIVLHHPDCCPRIPCLNPDTPSHPGMAALSVDEVYDAARQLLQHTAHRR